jgi:3-oxoacyl-[acyl-carrier-protein] synthase III
VEVTVRTQEFFIKSIGIYLPDVRAVPANAQEDEELRPEGMASYYTFESCAVATGIPAADMAVRAAREALSRAGTGVDLHIHTQLFRQGPESLSPAGYILHQLGISGIASHEVAQGCNGILAALQVCAGWLTMAHGAAAALVTTSLNAGVSYLDRCRSAGPGTVLGDGAAAAVLGKDSGIARVDVLNSVVFPELEALHRGDAPLLDTDSGVRESVDMLSRSQAFAREQGRDPLDLLEQITKMTAETAQRSLDEAGITAGDLAKVIHPNLSPAVMEASVLRPLNLTLDRSAWDFGRTVGHLGAADYLVSLGHLLRTGQLSAGDRVLLIGGTAGFTVSSAVLTITAP